MLPKQEKRKRRHKRIRAKVSGTAKVPRLSVFRSLNHIYAQLIDDEKGKIIVSSNDTKISNQKSNLKDRSKEKEGKKEEIQGRKVAIAYKVGKLIAEKSIDKKIKKVIFDRGGYKYHGRIKALAEGARDGGLKF